jgi:hypothetical protein
MDSCDDTPKGWVAPFGYPWINACSRLPMAFRSVPRPSSPPGTKASTECPSLARDRRAPYGAHPPCTETILSFSSGLNPRAESFTHNGIALAQHTTVHASEHQPHRWTLSVRSDIRWKCAETHQNLIHRDKDHPGHNRRSGRLLSETPPASQFQRTKMPIAVASPRYACSELDPESRSPHSPNMVEVIGLEPTTPCLQSRCSPS